MQGDATNPNAAISETERLITKDGVKITTGSFASPIAIAVSQAAERHGVFHWETTGAAEIITRRGFKYTFQVGAPARKYGQAAVDFVRRRSCQAAEEAGRRSEDRAAVGKPRVRQVGRRRHPRLFADQGHQARL